MINHRTGTIVVTTGNHGDKTKRFSFEAYRILENGQAADKPEWFLKISFDELTQ
jgi:hypothetical protein